MNKTGTFFTRLRWILKVMVFFLVLMTAYRVLFFFFYRPVHTPLSGSAFWLGFRFDARYVAILGLSLFLITAFPFLNPFRNFSVKKGWTILLTILFVITLVFYTTDFYHYDYLNHRLSASVLTFLEDVSISAQMMWETYPVIPVTIVLVVLVVFFIKWMRRWLNVSATQEVSIKQQWIYGSLFVLLCGVCLFGKLSQYPLRWSDAYALGNEFKASVALNPFQSFFSTMKFRNSGYNKQKMEEVYPLIASYLGVEKQHGLNFERKTYFDTEPSPPFNVVLVLCESFAAPKSSMFGNALNPTPYFDTLSKKGVFFTRCFTPSFGTARGVWALITGIPDVNRPKTASRNPLAVDQHTIINDFKSHNKYYFLGGSTTWANIRGLLANNIEGLKIFEEDHFKSGKEDVWGISDKNLFLESDKILRQSDKPFFAIIQTANNHRPYTIPDEDLKEFEKVTYPDEVLRNNLFKSNEELNAFRYMDFSIQKFMETAATAPYFNNTVFVFVGDHGLRGGAGDLFPESFSKYDFQAEHVPLLFYMPALLEPAVRNDVCSQLDILPSVAYLTKQSFSNTTLGMNLFTGDSTPRYAFIADPEKNCIAMVGDAYYWEKSATGQEVFVSVQNNASVPVNSYTDSLRLYMKNLTEAYYETARYLLLNNKKKP
jgi:phosphoglycerol transferase MdoB-like AlkP superfamily enzyme